jgi:acyl-CoA synthetase (NDP forming)
MSYEREQMDAVFSPSTVAVVGAPRSFKPGLVFLQALLDPGFKGNVYPINPKAGEILGLKAYPSIGDVPEQVDLAIVLVSIGQLMDVIRECAEKGVKAAIVFTSGFGESGNPGGLEREREMVAAAAEGGLRLVGPNCMGVYCPGSGLAFFPSMPSTSGPLSFVSQSGSMGAFVTLMATQRGISLCKVVSIGNECDLSSADFIDYLADDDETKIITAYLEGTRDGRGLLKALKKASLKKPVVVWKSGTTKAGARAVASHTGSLAGSDVIWDSALRQSGAIRVHSVEEMIDIATAFHYVPEATGKRIAIISGPGGPAVAAADALERCGLELAELSSSSIAKLEEFVPLAGASLKNPIDLGVAPWGILSLYPDTLKVIDEDDNVDAALLIGGGLDPSSQQVYLDMMLDLKPRLTKPCIMISLASFDGEAEFCASLNAVGYPLFNAPEKAIHAYSKVIEYNEWCKRAAG